MNEVEAIKRGVAPVQVELTNTETPYTVSGFTASSLNVFNNDTTNTLTITVTHDGSDTTVVTVPPSTTWSDQLKFFKTLATSGSADFKIQVKGWNPDDQ